MDHCAIDVGGRKSQICVRDQAGVIQYEGAWETAAVGNHLRELPHLSLTRSRRHLGYATRAILMVRSYSAGLT
jgi:hypothetical protein